MIHPNCRAFIQALLPDDISEETLHNARSCAIEPLVRNVLQRSDTPFDLKLAANVALYWTTLRIALDALATTPVIVLKGMPLARRLFDDELLRESTDVDLWIDPSSLQQADAALKSIGYTPTPVIRSWATNQVLYVDQTGRRLPIELHWALTQPPLRAPSFQQAWNQCLSVSAHGLTWHELSDDHTWIALLFHMLQHVFAIKPWLDLAQAASVLHINPVSLRRFGLSHIHAIVLNAVSFDAQPTGLTRLIRRFYDNLLMTNRGHLIFGQHSSLEAAAGALSRATSMLLLDGFLYRAYILAFYTFLGIDILRSKLKY